MGQEGISRRSFIRMAGVAATGAALALVGCGGNGAASSATASSAASSASESNSSTSESTASATTSSTASPAGGTSLIVLWSWSGNTLQMANRVSALSGAENAWTHEIRAHRSLSQLGMKVEQIDEVASTVVCLPSGFKRLTAEDVAAILRESM